MPYWRLSTFYFFYFSSLGTLIFYWSVYLESLGFSRQESGELIAILAATKIVSPMVWGWIADHTGRRMSIVRSGALMAALSFIAVFWVTSYWPLALVIMVFSFFWNAVLPQFEATTFNHLGEQVHRYSAIRLWGSIGFIIFVWLVGWGIDLAGIGILPVVVLIIFIAIWLSALVVPEQAARHLPLDHEPLTTVLRKPHVAGLLVVCFLMQAGHGPYYAFFTPYMKSHGYSVGFTGGLIAFGVVAEVLIFWSMHRWMDRFSLRHLLVFSLAVAALRWLLIGALPEVLPVVLFAQSLHAISFGVYHAVSIQLIHTWFTGMHQGKGQALYSSVSFGLGGAVGSLYAGYSWEYVSPQMMWWIAAGASVVGVLVAVAFLPKRVASSA